ncbi:translocation/assembly module TamB domain-containing protein [Erythrobacter mangrovi]|uniref:Translocation/assembly module TamB domain-containing protein n=1 Tax=Erythrobacter mangrovi TaxID=2739433 RepID=A0A7D3X9P6_9SPHN|nr:translocation/assembly module TamB domain-containing protein [Erythrobacter mangrovi]QKG70160.1 translocation/assembly module TamB domain-containing protein [Erythrobacter mangrovi]
MAEEAAIEATPAHRSWRRRIARTIFGGLAALVLLVVAGLVILNTPLGERFLASRIAERTLPNGLNIVIGRIEGNIYGAAVLHDVRLSDPQGVFMTIPRVEIDWNPGAWLSNRLEIDSFAARRAMLDRVPEFLPSDEGTPILPGFDISVDRFEIDNLTLAKGIAGEQPQRIDLDGQVQVADRRLHVDARGRFGQRDRLVLLLDAEPDGDNFDLALDLDAARDGPVAALVGLKAEHVARIRGKGTWSKWDGGLLVRSAARRVAALQLTNRAGRIGILGKVDPSQFLSGLSLRALGSDVAIQSEFEVESRVFDGQVVVVGSRLQATARGELDLADNEAHALVIEAVDRDPALLGETVRLGRARLQATLDGPLAALSVPHELTVATLDIDGIVLSDLRQRGTARLADGVWSLPLDLTVSRVVSGNAWFDPRLVTGTGRGTLVLQGARLTSDDLRLAFPGALAALALRGDLAKGTFSFKGPLQADRLALDNIGALGGTAMLDLTLASNAPWKLGALVDARVAPVTNATLANVAGAPIRLRGAFAAGGAAPLTFDGVRVDSDKLALVLDGSLRDGTTKIAGTGRHVDYGDFSVDASIAEGGPEAVLVFAAPVSGLEDVRVAIAPTAEGFLIDTEGGSLLGPFMGRLGLVMPAGGPTRIAIENLRVSDTSVAGDLTIVDGAAQGDLTFDGGGLNGTLDLAPRGGGQGLEIDLRARNASFGGQVPLRIARATIQGSGLLRKGHSSFTGSGRASGVSYGTLFIGRLAAKGEVEDGVGSFDASLAGRRGERFSLDLNARVAPERVAIAARGEFAGHDITMPRRAVLSRVEGGWKLAPTQLNYGQGGTVVSGQFGGDSLELNLMLAKMPLSLIDLARADTGLGGTISGTIDYRLGANRLPVGTAKVQIEGLTRSGLVLTSRPVDVSLMARLRENSLEARAVLGNQDIRKGRAQARITDLPQSGMILERLRAGQLFAQLRYSGAAESLWRLAAVEAFDITGAISVAADATGTLADPRVFGSVSSDSLRVRSALSGTDIRNVSARGRFSGSRLHLTRFAGTTANGGSVTGSGIVDLRTLGEPVEGRVLEIRGPTLDVRASVKNARLLDAQGLSATITGPLRIVSDGLGGTIAGRVIIDRASWRLGTAADDLRLPQIATREINSPDDRGPRTAPARPWRYLVNAKGSSRIDVDGMGLDSEWGADIVLRGTTAEPRIGGRAQVVRGTYTFAGSRFELTRGRIEFDERSAIDPRLDILAESDRDGLAVEVAVRGSATQPEITFSSSPALPEEEILARLLFGGSITSLSATDALQLGAAVASLRGGGGLDPINQLRSAIGLDRLRIVSADPALGRGTGVALGKNFGRRFYAEIITDGRGYSATEVEFRVTSWISLLAAVSTVGRDSVRAEISRDY